MMLITSFLFIPYHVIVQALPIAIIPEADTVVNVEKGFVLERIGTYSHKINEAIIHTFIHLKDICRTLPGTEICLRASGSTDNSIEIGTTLSVNDKHWSFSHYEKKNISKLITEEINILFSNKKPEEFLLNVPTNFHFFNGYFYVNTRRDQSIDRTVQLTDEQNEPLINDQINTPHIALEQLRNNRIGFDFLRDDDIRVILAPIMQSIEKSYETANVQTLVTHFTPLIVSQTVNAFRRCSFNQNDPSSPSCLIVSTFFTMPSTSPVDKYTTYNLLPIPIIPSTVRRVI